MPGLICDISQVLKAQSDLANKQLPFAVARALTLTAQDAQTQIRSNMGQRFTIRNAWSQRGIVVKPADKNVVPARSAVFVGDLWAYLLQQETGGMKVPTHLGTALGISTSSGHIAVPVDIRATPTQILVKSLRPKALLARKDVFIKDLGGAQAIMQRLPQHKLRLLYILAASATIHPRLGLVETALKVGEQRWAINFAASFQVALATAR